MKLLTHLKASGRLPPALLLQGSNLDREARAFAEHFAIPADIHELRPEGKMGLHAVAALSSFLSKVPLRPLRGTRQFFIVHQADRMLPTSSNALLKILEEPPPSTHFILTAQHKERLLPTILSRVQCIVFPPTPVPRTPLQDRFLQLLSGATLKEIEEFASLVEKEKKEMEKQKAKTLPKELHPLQRERLENEISGAISMHMQETLAALLEMLLLVSRDTALTDHKECAPHLHFPHLHPPHPLPFPLVERAIHTTRLSFERSIPLQACLEALFAQLALIT